MKTCMLGKSGLEVGPLAFGGNVFGWTIDEATSFRLLDAFVAAGFKLIDTADVYSRWAPGNQGGESETIIGKWLKQSGKRDQVILATKVGMALDKRGLGGPYIKRSVEDSLKRLQTDHIDLYQAHKDDPETPLEETLGAFHELIQQGKVRVIGASNYSAERLSEVLKVSRDNGLAAYQALQPEYNLCERAGFEDALEPVCREAGLGVIPYYSLASGFLTGKYRSEADLAKSARGQGVKKYLDDRGFRILAALDDVAGRYSSTPGRVAIAWLLARPSVTAPIASATSVAQLDDLIEATRLELDGPAIERLNQASA
ncbi:Predicted oxidoreductase [Singulisphaera sp. GP187]|uniref:aldo/keto reductase n=1 Tax=Singulisphaera sp. GP187 TaxID=1882752 RepID=UPI0009280214|nr:aldo/keto reductase [Singulisphaera sp. GP187]SIN95948.1 Predicted oxidoreductase [Singulisphaera sp. GP187]